MEYRDHGAKFSAAVILVYLFHITVTSVTAQTLGTVTMQAGQQIVANVHTTYFRCVFTIEEGFNYNIQWYAVTSAFYETGQFNSTEAAEKTILTDDAFVTFITTDLLPLIFGAPLYCVVTVYDGTGTTPLGGGNSAPITAIQVSANFLTIVRGQEATLTITLNIPFGCASSDCYLRYILYDPTETYDCGDSSYAAVSSEDCGAKIEGTTPATIGQWTASSTITNITITTINNWWYRFQSSYTLVLQLSAVGNTKQIWNVPATTISVTVQENDLAKNRGCYSYVDPYILTFDLRWYENHLTGVFRLFLSQTHPVEIQTKTMSCDRGNSPLTCSCGVSVRAGGDVFTIDHCEVHFTGYRSTNDGILKVYQTWSTYYRIILPRGMEVYVHVMPNLYYMMNIYVVPAMSDFEHSEGLCGNFNGDSSDDTRLRNTGTVSSVESITNRSWSSDYYFPDDFIYSWMLETEAESLWNQEVYGNVGSWDSDKKLCVCRTAVTSNFDATCSATEEGTCVTPISRSGTLIDVSTRTKRDVQQPLSPKFKARRLEGMRRTWQETNQQHTLRKKRALNTDTVLTNAAAKQICTDQLSTDCDAYMRKDDVSELANFTDNLDNCARDTMYNTTEWIQAHCDAYSQEVIIELERNLEFTENNSALAGNIRGAWCPGDCNGNGNCVSGVCVCSTDFVTDMCLLNSTESPVLEELAEGSVCDLSVATCDFILIVGNGFVEGAICNMSLYGAGSDGVYILIEAFQITCTYVNYNELLAPTSNPGASSRRRRDVTDTSNGTIATMVGASVSNDGSSFSTIEFVVILDSTCLQTSSSEPDEQTVVTVKTGYCYIDGTCYTTGTTSTNSTCDKCDSSNDVFNWSDGDIRFDRYGRKRFCRASTFPTASTSPDIARCNTGSSSKNNLGIILGCIGGVIFVGAVAVMVSLYCYNKSKRARLAPMNEGSHGPSNMTTRPMTATDIALNDRYSDGKKGNRMAAQFIPDD